MIGLLVENEVEAIWKEAVMDIFDTLPGICIKGLIKIMKTLIRISATLAEILTLNPMNREKINDI